jgi:hypothetical protein
MNFFLIFSDRFDIYFFIFSNYFYMLILKFYFNIFLNKKNKYFKPQRSQTHPPGTATQGQHMEMLSSNAMIDYQYNNKRPSWIQLHECKTNSVGWLFKFEPCQSLTLVKLKGAQP